MFALSLGAAAVVTAQCVAGKATRDALFLTSLDFAALPAMLVAASVCSILLLLAQGWAARRVRPAVLRPAALAGSSALFVAEWILRDLFPAATAVLVYLHVTASGALIASGLWLLLSERFDPRSAKRHFGRIAAAGTLGGLAGGLGAERVAAMAGAPAMLLVLAGLHVFTAALMARLVTGGSIARGGRLQPDAPADAGGVLPEAREPARSALGRVAGAPHLRDLAALVLLGTTSAALLEYLFKARAVDTFGPGDNLLRFFAVYYAGVSLVTLVLQALSTRPVLERFGLGLAASTPSIAVLTGSLANLVVPGFGSLLVARGSESALRASWFRAGYELFYTPMPLVEKRAAKALIDVGVDRAGDALGGALIRVVMLFGPAAQSSTILGLAMAGSVAAVIAAARLHGWYVVTLEGSLMRQGRGRGRPAMADESIRHRVAGLHGRQRPTHLRLLDTAAATTTRIPSSGDENQTRAALDPDLRDIQALRSRDRRQAIEVLCRERGLSGALIHHAIPLLGVNALADHALFALCKVAEEHVGELTDALLDPTTEPVVRRRLARVFAVCVSQRAADALLAALEDGRFDVRFQAARSLAAIRGKNPRVTVDRERVHAAVLRAAHGDQLAYVFELLALVLPAEPLHAAFHGLHADDPQLRGTALEYLEGVLPSSLRQRLWPAFLQARGGRPMTPAEAVAAIGDAPGSARALTRRLRRAADFGSV
jgi:hypothetical protein